jgi:hypothetical protein
MLFQNILLSMWNFQIYIIIWQMCWSCSYTTWYANDPHMYISYWEQLHWCSVCGPANLDVRNISTSSHAEHPWSYSQSKWVLTWPPRKQLQIETKCWKDFWVHDFFTYNLGPQWHVGLSFVIYACPFIKAPLKLWYVWEVWPFLYEYFWFFDSQKFQIAQILSL